MQEALAEHHKTFATGVSLGRIEQNFEAVQEKAVACGSAHGGVGAPRGVQIMTRPTIMMTYRDIGDDIFAFATYTIRSLHCTAGSLVESHVNEHGDGVVTVVRPKEMMGLLPLAMVRGPATQSI